MAMGPYEAGLSPEQRAFLDIIDEQIEQALKEDWPLNQLSMVREIPIVAQDWEFGQPVRAALCERYRQAGWKNVSVVATETYYSLRLER